jgi:hypothetical protein
MWCERQFPSRAGVRPEALIATPGLIASQLRPMLHS